MFRLIVVIGLLLFFGSIFVGNIDQRILLLGIVIASVVGLIWGIVWYRRNQQNRYAQKPQPIIRPNAGE
jgi:hypothetical protein